MTLSTTENEKSHYRGRYVIRMARQGNAWVYDILTRGGMLVAAGFDLLSQTEAAALEGIATRYGIEVET